MEQRYPTSTICYPRNICQNNQQKIRQFSEVIDFIDEWKKKISDKNILVDYFHSGHRRSGLK